MIKRKYKLLDLTRFSDLTEDNIAYILGVIATDGYISPDNVLSFGFQSRDQYWFKKILKELNVNNKLYIKTDPNTLKKYVYTNITCPGITNVLYEYNIIPNKSLTLMYPKNLEKKFQRHFIRGLWDGDGSIVFHYNEKKFAFIQDVRLVSASKCFLIEAGNILKKDNINSIITTEHRKKSGRSDLYTLRIQNKDLMKFYHYLYDDTNLYLYRKKKKFLKLYRHREKMLRIGVSGRRRQKLKLKLTREYIISQLKNKISVLKISKKVGVNRTVIYDYIRKFEIHISNYL